MEVQTTEQQHAARKRNLRLIAGLFLGLLTVFTLLSNTLLALTLPKVAADHPRKGRLVQSYQGSAIVEPAEQADLKNPAGWKMTQVLVKEGDTVRQGEALVTYDGSEAKQQIANEQAALDKLKLMMAKLQYEYIRAAQSGDEGARLSAKAAIDGANIDIGTQEAHLQYLQHNLAANEALVAPFDGIVTSVRAAEGVSGMSGGPDIRLANRSRGFQAQLQVPVGIAGGLAIGDALEMRLLGKESRAIKGNVAKIEDIGIAPDAGSSSGSKSGEAGTTGAASLLTVSVRDQALQGGERIQVNLSQSADEDALLIPNKAVHKDNTGTYVYVVEARTGPLGNAYYAARRSVAVSDAGDYETAVTSGLFEQDQVIVERGEPIQDGSRVRL